MGICHTCDVPLVAGRVRDLRTGEVFDEPGQAVQICIAGAAGDCHIDLSSTTPAVSSPTAAKATTSHRAPTETSTEAAASTEKSKEPQP